MAPSSLFLRGLPRRITKRDQRKVFVLGFHKTGTTSLAKALLVLGYRVCGFVNPKPDVTPATHTKEELFESRYKLLLTQYDAFQDIPWFIFYKETAQLYSDAKFILTVRPADKWLNSVLSHMGGADRKSNHWIYDGKGDPVGNEALYLEKYNQHNRDAVEFFENSNMDFIRMDMPEDFNWNVLCNFLECSKPIGRFPHANTANSRYTIKNRILYRLRNLYYSFEDPQKF